MHLFSGVKFIVKFAGAIKACRVKINMIMDSGTPIWVTILVAVVAIVPQIINEFAKNLIKKEELKNGLEVNKQNNTHEYSMNYINKIETHKLEQINTYLNSAGRALIYNNDHETMLSFMSAHTSALPFVETHIATTMKVYRKLILNLQEHESITSAEYIEEIRIATSNLEGIAQSIGMMKIFIYKEENE